MVKNRPQGTYMYPVEKSSEWFLPIIISNLSIVMYAFLIYVWIGYEIL